MMLSGGVIGLVIKIGTFIITILLGFPIAFTLVAMGVIFGYYAMGRPYLRPAGHQYL